MHLDSLRSEALHDVARPGLAKDDVLHLCVLPEPLRLRLRRRPRHPPPPWRRTSHHRHRRHAETRAMVAPLTVRTLVDVKTAAVYDPFTGLALTTTLPPPPAPDTRDRRPDRQDDLRPRCPSPRSRTGPGPCAPTCWGRASGKDPQEGARRSSTRLSALPGEVPLQSWRVRSFQRRGRAGGPRTRCAGPI